MALPEINRLMKKGDIPAAFALARRAEEMIPTDPARVALWPLISAKVTIETQPSGADIFVKPTKYPTVEWEYVGKSPLKDVRLPLTARRYQLRRDGYAPIEKTDVFWGASSFTIRWRLDEMGAAPPGMVRVQSHPEDPASVALGDFWIDKFEVTNREFKKFVERGGYATERFWKNPLMKDGQRLAWNEAMKLFRDRTGPRTCAGIAGLLCVEWVAGRRARRGGPSNASNVPPSEEETPGIRFSETPRASTSRTFACYSNHRPNPNQHETPPLPHRPLRDCPPAHGYPALTFD